MKHASLLKTFTPYAASALMALSGSGCAAGTNAPASPPPSPARQTPAPPLEPLTAGNFDDKVFSAPGLVIVDFSAEWCPGCQHMKPLLAQLAADRKDTLKIYTLDIDKEEGLARLLNAEYGLKVAFIPFLAAFKNGEVVAKFENKPGDPATAAGLSAWADKALQAAQALPEPPRNADAKATDANDLTFAREVLERKGLVLVDFVSEKCGAYCDDLKIEDIARREAGKIAVVRMQVEDSLVTARALKVLNEENKAELPALLVFKDGEVAAKIKPEDTRWQTIRVLNAVIAALEAPAKAATPSKPALSALPRRPQ